MNASPVLFGLVVNPVARAVKRRHLRGAPFWRGVVPDELVRLTGSVAELDEAIVAFRDAGVRAVAVLGGDGSVHRVVDAVVSAYGGTEPPPLLALAGGTMNGVSRALGTRGAPARVLRAAIAAVATSSPRTRRQHVLRVTDAVTGRVYHGFGFATGLVYRAYHHYYRRAEPGMLEAIRASLLPLTAALLGGGFYEGVQLDVWVAGERWLPEPAHTLVASVLDRPLLWFQPFGAPLGDAAAFHLAATSMRPREIAPRLWSLFRGRCRHPRLRIGHIREAAVQGEAGYLIDGDLYPAEGAFDVRLTVGPSLRFLAPVDPRSGR